MDTCNAVWESVRHWIVNFDNWPTIIIAAAAVFISYQQWRLAQNKFKHDLYEKRLEIYLGAEKFLFSVIQTARVDQGALSELVKCTRNSIFLLKKEDFD